MRQSLFLLPLLGILAACAAPIEVTNGFDGTTPPNMRALIEVTR